MALALVGAAGTGSVGLAPAAAAAAVTTPTAAAGYCQVATPPQWTRAMQSGRLPGVAGLHSQTLAVSADGLTRFVVLSDATSQRLVEMHGKSTAYRVIARYPSGWQSGTGFGMAGFDGRHLAYLVNTDSSDTTWKIYSYDTRGTAAPRLIGAQQDLEVPAGPFVVPQVSAGLATWVQPLRDGTRQVHAYDLAAHRDRVVTTAHVYRSVFAGDLLVWQVSPAPDAPTVLRAVDVRTWAPVRLPAPLAAVRDAWEVVSDGTRWFWLSSDFSGISAWQPGWARPVTVLAGGAGVQGLGLAGRLLSYTDDTATYLVDLSSHSRTRATPRWGLSEVNGTRMEIGYLATDSKTAPLVEYEVNSAALPRLPHCPAPSAP